MSERALAIAIAQRPDARRDRLQEFVDYDMTALVDRDVRCTSNPRSSVFGRRPTASNTCDPTISGSPVSRSTPTQTSTPRGSKWMHSAANLTSMFSASGIARMAAEMSGSSRWIGALDHLDHGDLRPEPPIDLGELQSDVASANGRQMAQQLIEARAGWCSVGISA